MNRFRTYTYESKTNKLHPMEKLVVGNQEILFDYRLENGIIIGTFESQFIDLDIAKRITDSRVAFQKGKTYPLLSNIKNIKGSTKAARDYMASKDGCQGVIAAAVLIDSPIGSMIGNFFIRVSKPFVPTQIFTDEAEAKKWLSQYVKRG